MRAARAPMMIPMYSSSRVFFSRVWLTSVVVFGFAPCPGGLETNTNQNSETIQLLLYEKQCKKETSSRPESDVQDHSAKIISQKIKGFFFHKMINCNERIKCSTNLFANLRKYPIYKNLLKFYWNFILSLISIKI